MSVKNRLSAMIVDRDTTSRDYLSKALDRLGIVYSAVEREELLLKLVKKSFFGRMNYNLFIINDNLLNNQTEELLTTLNAKYGKKITILIVVEEDNKERDTKYYQEGAKMVIPFDVFQSYLFNWYMHVTQGKIIKRNAEEGKYNFCGRTVLLVEDNVINREITHNLLEIVDLKVITACDGIEAIEKFKESSTGEIDLILMDIQMPNIDGYKATDEIRNSNHPDSKSIPIIALTANSLPEDLQEEKKHQLTDHISKPISTKTLYDIIEKYLNN